MTHSASCHSVIPLMYYFNRTVGGGQWTVDSGLWTVDGGQWMVDSGRWTVDGGQWTVYSCSAVGIPFTYLNPLWVQIPVGSTDFLSCPQNPDHMLDPTQMLLLRCIT
jgi:hypothetical protein